jgi:hypothetical protein
MGSDTGKPSDNDAGKSASCGKGEIAGDGEGETAGGVGKTVDNDAEKPADGNAYKTAASTVVRISKTGMHRRPTMISCKKSARQTVTSGSAVSRAKKTAQTHGKIAVIIPGTRPETRPYAAVVVVVVSAVASLATVGALDATAPVTVSDTNSRTPARARITRKRITAAELEVVIGWDAETIPVADNSANELTPNAAMPPLTAVSTKINHLFSFIISMILAQNRSLSNFLHDSQNLSKIHTVTVHTYSNLRRDDHTP